MESLNVGNKHDASKPRFTLVPPHALSAVMEALEHGAQKYGAENWRMLPDLQTRYTDSSMRHIRAAMLGENIDPDSGCYHLANAICGLMFKLEDLILRKSEEDVVHVNK